MSIYKDILKHSLAYSVAVVLGKITSVLLLPLYTRYLSPADYGTLELLDLTIFVVSILVGTHLSDAFLFFYSKASDEAERRRILSTAFQGATAAGVVVMGAAFVLAPALSTLIFRSDRYAFYFRVAFANLAFLFAGEIAAGKVRFERRSTTLMKLQLARLGLAIGLNVAFLVLFRLGLASILYSNLICTAFATVALAWLTQRGIRPSWDARILAHLFRYAFPIGLGGLAMMLVNFGDRYFLQHTVSIADIGIYSLAYKIGMLVSYTQWIFNMYWTSQMFTVLNRPEGARFYSRISTYYTVVVTLGWLMIAILARPLLHLLATPRYAAAAVFVPGIGFAYLLRSLGEHFRSMIFVEKRPDIETRVTFFGAAVCLVCYTVLIPRYRLAGAVAATIVAFLAMAVFGFWKAQRLRRCTFEYRRLALVGVTAAIIMGAHLLLDPQTLLWQLVWAAGAACGYAGLLALFGFLDGAETHLLAQNLRSLGMRARRVALGSAG